MASDIWFRTILIVRKETRCRHICYSYRLTARVLLYAPSHRQDNHGLCYTIVEHWLEREIAQRVHPMKDRSDDPRTMSERSTSELRPAPYSPRRVAFSCVMLLFSDLREHPEQQLDVAVPRVTCHDSGVGTVGHRDGVGRLRRHRQYT